MINKTQILTLFLMLLVIPTSTVYACGNSSEKHKTEKESCSKEHHFSDKKSCSKEHHSDKKSCCDDGEKDNDGFGGACDNTSCLSPIVVNIYVSHNNFELSDSNNFKLLINWTYVQNKPKTGHLSIWQPPKIS